MRAAAAYTLARLGLLAGFAAALYAAGARGILLVLLSFALSGLASLVLLTRLRDAMSASLFERRQRASVVEEAAAAEDAEDEARRRAGGAPGP